MLSTFLSPALTSHNYSAPLTYFSSSLCSPRTRRRRASRDYTSWDQLNDLSALTTRVTYDLLSSLGGTSSAIYLTDNTDDYTLNLKLPELAGRRLNELELHVEGPLLTLSIPALKLTGLEGLRPLWEEIKTGDRVEKIRIPHDVDSSQITATLRGERLTITLPKAKPEKRSINIQ